MRAAAGLRLQSTIETRGDVGRNRRREDLEGAVFVRPESRMTISGGRRNGVCCGKQYNKKPGRAHAGKVVVSPLD